MNSNLQTQLPQNSSAGFKHILLRKLSYAVTCSVISQLIILFWYIFILNFSVFAPVKSVTDYVLTLTSVGTWAYILMLSLTKKCDAFVGSLKEKLGVNFMFQELPEASVQKCLGDGQAIVWLVQALSCLCSRSLEEDRYGVAQKDLPAIVSALIELKVSVEKLNRLPALNRRAHAADDFDCQMKWGIANALRRSIYNIVDKFGPYLKDFNLRRDVRVQLQAFGLRSGHY